MSKRKSNTVSKLELALARGFMKICQLLPHRKAQAMGRFLGGVFHDLVGIRKQVAREQLKQAFPDKDDKWILKTIRNVYRNMGIVAVETARLPVMKGDELRKWVVFNGKEHIPRLLERGNGVLVASAHIGGWEYNGAWTANEGWPVTYVVAEQANELIEELIDDARKSVGIEIIKRSDAARGLIKALKNNRILAMMIDQDARSHGDFVPFFGRLASTFRGVALMALKMNSNVAVITAQRKDDGKIYCELRPVEFEPSGERDKDVYDLTKRLTEMIEEDIRKTPDQWLWLHKRWKTKPPAGFEQTH